MKSIISILLVASVGVFGFVAYRAANPCASPLEYSIGEFDPQFGVSKTEFENKIESGASIWEKAFSKNFFEYNSEAKFKINLIYDQRQKEVDAKRRTEFGLSKAESDFKAVDSNFKTFKSNYEARASVYESAKANFLQESKQYENDVERANKKGGTTPKEYEDLKQRQTELNTKANSLNSEASALNIELTQLNKELDQRNKAAQEYNKIAESYNQKYGSGLEFDQAEYTGKQINVYEFGNGADLTIALSHELGHALGMNHVENENSIMFYRTGQQNLSPTKEDLAELKRICKL